MKILNLQQATEFLGLNDSEALRRLAAKRQVPGRKVGKEWRFVDTQLAEWIGAQYHDTQQVVVGDQPEEQRLCHSTSAMACTTSKPAPQTAASYAEVLGLGTK